MPATAYYHGSSQLFSELREGSWVTPYLEDAISFGIPWDSNDLEDQGDESGRPPWPLRFKSGKEPPDGPLFIYAVDAPTESTTTNTGVSYDWNRRVVNAAPVRLIASYPSWKMLVPRQ